MDHDVILAAVAVLFMVTWVLTTVYQTRKNQQHILQVLDRFLSRNFEEYGMTDMIKKETEIDQGADTAEDIMDDETVQSWLVSSAKAREIATAHERKAE